MSSEPSSVAVEKAPSLGTISEDTKNHELCDSPIIYSPATAVTDFVPEPHVPARSLTHPATPLHSVARTGIQPSARLRGMFSLRGYRRSGRNSPLRRSFSLESQPAFQNVKRNSTGFTKTSASLEETAMWDRKAVLSLDGGGIRGYSALLILQALMIAIGKLETEDADPAESSFHPLPQVQVTATDAESLSGRISVDTPKTESSSWLPCHYFDYMAGTSTGGLISIMLGRLRMNIDDCIRDYEKFGERVFGHSRWFHLRSLLFIPRDKYNHKVLEKVVQEVVDERVPYVASFPGGRNFTFDENRCRIVVLSYQKQDRRGVEKPYLFRSYKNLHRGATATERLLDRNPGLAHDIPIWQVARATSAAPTYFELFKIGELEYMDGGFGANNPCMEIYDEVRKMNNNSDSCTSLILSVGTGKNTKTSRFSGSGFSRYLNYLNFARKWATDSEKTHLDMLRQRDHSDFKFHYWRLNVDDGLDTMKLDEWQVRGRLRTSIGKGIGWLRSAKDNLLQHQNQNIEEHPEKTTDDASDTPSQTVQLRIPKWFEAKNETLESIKTSTENYIQRGEVQEWIQECAKLLVENRRERAKSDPARWEKACFGAWYQCNIEKCQRAEKEYESREALRSHLLDKHRTEFTRAPKDEAKLNDALDRCKMIVH